MSPKSNPFLVNQTTLINQKSIMMSLFFFTLLKILIPSRHTTSF